MRSPALTRRYKSVPAGATDRAIGALAATSGITTPKATAAIPNMHNSRPDRMDHPLLVRLKRLAASGPVFSRPRPTHRLAGALPHRSISRKPVEFRSRRREGHRGQEGE